MPYEVRFSSSAEREFDALPRQVKRRVRAKVDALANDPRPYGVEKLSGEKRAHRIRIGAYRVVYEIHDDALLVLVIAVGPREHVYKRRA